MSLNDISLYKGQYTILYARTQVIDLGPYGPLVLLIWIHFMVKKSVYPDHPTSLEDRVFFIYFVNWGKLYKVHLLGGIWLYFCYFQYNSKMWHCIWTSYFFYLTSQLYTCTNKQSEKAHAILCISSLDGYFQNHPLLPHPR